MQKADILKTSVKVHIYTIAPECIIICVSSSDAIIAFINVECITNLYALNLRIIYDGNFLIILIVFYVNIYTIMISRSVCKFNTNWSAVITWAIWLTLVLW